MLLAERGQPSTMDCNPLKANFVQVSERPAEMKVSDWRHSFNFSYSLRLFRRNRSQTDTSRSLYAAIYQLSKGFPRKKTFRIFAPVVNTSPEEEGRCQSMTALALNTIQIVDGSARRTLCPLVWLTIQRSMGLYTTGRPLSKKIGKVQSGRVPVPNTFALSSSMYDAIAQTCKAGRVKISR